MWSWVLSTFGCQGEGVGYSKLPLFPFFGYDILRWYACHTTLPPFQQNFWVLWFISNALPPYSGVVKLSPAPREVELRYLENLRASVWALDPYFQGPVVPGVESDSPPSRVGFSSPWALPIS